MSKNYILFDLDGTLTDPMEGITKSVQHALRFYGIEESELRTLCPFIGPPLKDSFMKYYDFSREQAVEAIGRNRRYLPEGFWNIFLWINTLTSSAEPIWMRPE